MKLSNPPPSGTNVPGGIRYWVALVASCLMTTAVAGPMALNAINSPTQQDVVEVVTDSRATDSRAAEATTPAVPGADDAANAGSRVQVDPIPDASSSTLEEMAIGRTEPSSTDGSSEDAGAGAGAMALTDDADDAVEPSASTEPSVSSTDAETEAVDGPETAVSVTTSEAATTTGGPTSTTIAAIGTSATTSTSVPADTSSTRRSTSTRQPTTARETSTTRQTTTTVRPRVTVPPTSANATTLTTVPASTSEATSTAETATTNQVAGSLPITDSAESTASTTAERTATPSGAEASELADDAATTAETSSASSEITSEELPTVGTDETVVESFPTTYDYPIRESDCIDGEWSTFELAEFADQDECVEFVRVLRAHLFGQDPTTTLSERLADAAFAFAAQLSGQTSEDDSSLD